MHIAITSVVSLVIPVALTLSVGAQNAVPYLVTPSDPPPATDALAEDILRTCGSSRLRHGLSLPAMSGSVGPYFKEFFFLSPNGDTVYVAGWHALIAFDAKSGDRRFEYRYDGLNMSVRNRPAGLRVDFHQGPQYGNFVVLDHATGRTLQRGKRAGGRQNWSFVFSDDRRGLRFASENRDPRRYGPPGRGVVFLCDLATGERICSLGEQRRDLWSLSTDEKRLAFINSDMVLTVRDAHDGIQLAELPLGPLKKYRQPVAPVWSADGDFVYVWKLDGKHPQLLELNVDTGETRLVLIHPSERSAEPVVSRDRRYLAYRSQNPRVENPTWNVIRLDDLSEYRTLDVRPAKSVVAFSPDSRSLWLTTNCGIARYDLESGKSASPSADLLLESKRLGFSDDGKRLFGTVGDQLVTWDPATGRECSPRTSLGALIRRTPHARCVFISGDGKETVWAGGDSQVRRLEGERVTGEFYAANTRFGREYVLSSDGRRIIHDAYYGELRYGDMQTGRMLRELLPRYKQEREKYAMALAPDDRTLALVRRSHAISSRTDEIEIELWDLAKATVTGKLTQIGDPRDMHMLFSRDGGELWVWHRGRQTVWDLRTLTLRGSVVSAAPNFYLRPLMPNRRRYVRDAYRSLQLIELETNQVCRTWKRYGFEAMAFSADTGLLAVATGTEPVVLYDVYGRYREHPTEAAKYPLDDLWSALADETNAEKAFEALCELAHRGDESVEFLRDKLIPFPRQSPPRELPLPGAYLRVLRSAEALEVIGTPAAGQLLAEIAVATTMVNTEDR